MFFQEYEYLIDVEHWLDFWYKEYCISFDLRFTSNAKNRIMNFAYFSRFLSIFFSFIHNGLLEPSLFRSLFDNYWSLGALWRFVEYLKDVFRAWINGCWTNEPLRDVCKASKGCRGSKDQMRASERCKVFIRCRVFEWRAYIMI